MGPLCGRRSILLCVLACGLPLLLDAANVQFLLLHVNLYPRIAPQIGCSVVILCDMLTTIESSTLKSNKSELEHAAGDPMPGVEVPRYAADQMLWLNDNVFVELAIHNSCRRFLATSRQTRL